MQYDIDGGNITVVVGEEARMDVPTALNYIKSGQDEIETTVNAGIDAFDLNAANKTTDYNNNASAKVTAYNNNATAKTDDFDLNASGKTNDFNDNYTIKKGLIDASVDAAAGSASAASASADLAQQWAVKMDGKVADEDYSAKYYADLASQSAGATGANKDLSNLTAAGEARFTAKQDVISDLSTIRSGAALGDTSVQLSGAQIITGSKTFSSQIIASAGNGIQIKGTNHYYVMRSSGSPYEGCSLLLDNDLTKKAFSADASKITIGSSEIPAYANVPSGVTTSTSNEQIATTGWVNTVGNNVVHLSGTEAITGTKIFKADPIIKNGAPRLYMGDPSQTKGTAPSGSAWSAVEFQDNNGARLGLVRQLNDSTKLNRVELLVEKANASGDNSQATMSLYYPASGGAYATAPASSVNGSILTTVNKSKAAKGYYELGNGLIVQWGKSQTSDSSGVFTLPKAFTSTNYAVVITNVMANVPANRLSNEIVTGWGVVKSQNTGNFTAFLCNYENSHWWRDATKTVNWIAIGY